MSIGTNVQRPWAKHLGGSCAGASLTWLVNLTNRCRLSIRHATLNLVLYVNSIFGCMVGFRWAEGMLQLQLYYLFLLPTTLAALVKEVLFTNVHYTLFALERWSTTYKLIQKKARRRGARSHDWWPVNCCFFSAEQTAGDKMQTSIPHTTLSSREQIAICCLCLKLASNSDLIFTCTNIVIQHGGNHCDPYWIDICVPVGKELGYC